MIDREIGPDEWIVADHRIGETPVLPGAAFLEMAAAAAGRSGVTGPMRISAVRWLRPFEVTEPRSLHLAITGDNGRLVVELTDDEAGPYARGLISASSDDAEILDLAVIAARCPRRRSGEEVYSAFSRAGLHYGKSFRVLQELSSGRDEALGVLAGPPSHTGGSGAPHPSLLDGALQAIVGLLPEDGSAPAMPFAVDSVEILRPLITPAYAYVTRDADHRYSVRLADDRGRVCVRCTGVTLRPRKDSRRGDLQDVDSSEGSQEGSLRSGDLHGESSQEVSLRNEDLRGDPQEEEPRGDRRAEDAVEQMIFVPVWREAPGSAPAAGSGRPDGRVVVMHTPADEQVARALLTLHGGGETGPLIDGSPVLGAGPYDTVYVLARTGDGVTPAEADPTTLAFFRLVKHLIETGHDKRSLTLKIVVAGALPVTGEERVFPHAAGLIGLARAAGAEYPRWSVGCVDVGPASFDVMELAGRIRAETCADGLVALREGRRLVRVLEPAPAAGGREPYRNVLEPASAVEGQEPYRNVPELGSGRRRVGAVSKRGGLPHPGGNGRHRADAEPPSRANRERAARVDRARPGGPSDRPADR